MKRNAEAQRISTKAAHGEQSLEKLQNAWLVNFQLVVFLDTKQRRDPVASRPTSIHSRQRNEKNKHEMTKPPLMFFRSDCSRVTTEI